MNKPWVFRDMNIMKLNTILIKKTLPKSVTAVLLSSALLSGCSNDSGSSGNSNTLNANITSSIPANVVAGNQAILDAEVNVNGGQAANAALFTWEQMPQQHWQRSLPLTIPIFQGLILLKLFPMAPNYQIVALAYHFPMLPHPVC